MAKRILIVDDNANNVDLLTSMVRAAGYEVVEHDSGAAALAWLQDNPTDLVLLDVKMPHMDGYEVCRIIKSHGATAHIPVVFVSALGEQIDYNRMQEVGADAYLMKPVKMQQVLATIKKFI